MSSAGWSADRFEHVPVLAEPVLAAFAALPARTGLLIDCTLGGGGHSALLLEAHPQLRLVGLDQDPSARAAAADTLKPGGAQAMAEAGAAFTRSLALCGILAWEGIGDAAGKPVDPGETTILQLLDLWPAFEAIDRLYAGPALMRLDEKNV